MPIKLTMVDRYYNACKQVGDYYIDEEMTHFAVVLPNVGYVNLPIVGSDHPFWNFSGTVECPTLTPSIRSDQGNGKQWHGHVTNGELVEC